VTLFGQVTEENFDLHFNVNVKGLFFTVQKALPLMKDGGSIILNASIASSKGMQTAKEWCLRYPLIPTPMNRAVASILSTYASGLGTHTP
jgi:NAD(P)-dependent dehydrogenase (short-subunit alcohol dehydrogenase family)